MDSLFTYPIPADERQRLRDLERYGLIGSGSDSDEAARAPRLEGRVEVMGGPRSALREHRRRASG